MISRAQWKTDSDEADVVVGLWLFFSPWVLGTKDSVALMGMMTIVGLLVAADGLWALGKPEMKTPEWITFLAGAAVFLSPWLPGLGADGAIAWNAWIVGGVLMALAGTTLFVRPGKASSPTKAAR